MSPELQVALASIVSLLAIAGYFIWLSFVSEGPRCADCTHLAAVIYSEKYGTFLCPSCKIRRDSRA